MIRPSDALLKSAHETFANLAFMFIMDESADVAEGRPPWLAVTVSFTGPLKGKLTMRVSSEVPAPLAANMLGLADDQTPTREQQLDALRELLNVICGNMLPLLAGSDEVFNVGAPDIVDSSHLNMVDPMVLYLEAGQAEISLELM